MLFPLVLEYALMEITGHTDIQCSAAARHDIGAVASLVHDANRIEKSGFSSVICIPELQVLRLRRSA
jgi:hypothetical protein